MARGFLFAAVPIPFLALIAMESFLPSAQVAMSPATISAAPSYSLARPDPHEAVAVLLARPLFSRVRRPPIALSQTVPQPPRLSGIMITGAGRYAIFAPAGGHPIIAAEGSSVGVYKISEITTRQVIVRGPAGVVTLRTSYGASGAGDADAARPAPVPVVLPGGITLYPATKQNLPDAATWPGPAM
jgi:hypothetical protein